MSALRKTSIEKTGVHLQQQKRAEFRKLSKEQNNEHIEFMRSIKSNDPPRKNHKYSRDSDTWNLVRELVAKELKSPNKAKKTGEYKGQELSLR